MEPKKEVKEKEVREKEVKDFIPESQETKGLVEQIHSCKYLDNISLSGLTVNLSILI